MRKVLVGLDRSEYALRAATLAAELARAIPGLEVTAVMVVRPLPDGLYREEQGLAANGGGYDAQRIIRRAKEIFAEHGVEATFENISGTDPGLELCHYAADRGYDHIIVGKKGRASGDNGLALGSVAYKVLHLAPCPVTIVK